jgi:hypothetical protein
MYSTIILPGRRKLYFVFAFCNEILGEGRSGLRKGVGVLEEPGKGVKAFLSSEERHTENS